MSGVADDARAHDGRVGRLRHAHLVVAQPDGLPGGAVRLRSNPNPNPKPNPNPNQAAPYAFADFVVLGTALTVVSGGVGCLAIWLVPEEWLPG